MVCSGGLLIVRRCSHAASAVTHRRRQRLRSDPLDVLAQVRGRYRQYGPTRGGGTPVAGVGTEHIR